VSDVVVDVLVTELVEEDVVVVVVDVDPGVVEEDVVE
jgi:hypothetical protein